MSYAESVDAWIDMYHSIRRLARQDTLIFLTDNAVGPGGRREPGPPDREPGRRARACPDRPVSHGQALRSSTSSSTPRGPRRTASRRSPCVGGDQSSRPDPRSFPHAYQLRQWLRRRVPSLDLGGWVNPLKRSGQAGGLPAPPRLRGRVLPHPGRLPPFDPRSGALSRRRPGAAECPVPACSASSSIGAPTRARWSSSATSSRCRRRGSLGTSRRGSPRRRSAPAPSGLAGGRGG